MTMQLRRYTPWQPPDPRLTRLLDELEARDSRTMSDEDLRALQEECELSGEDEIVHRALLDSGWMFYDQPAPGEWRRDSRAIVLDGIRLNIKLDVAAELPPMPERETPAPARGEPREDEDFRWH